MQFNSAIIKNMAKFIVKFSVLVERLVFDDHFRLEYIDRVDFDNDRKYGLTGRLKMEIKQHLFT